MTRAAAGIVLSLSLLAPDAMATGRDEARAALSASDVEARRLAAAALVESGTEADAPALVRALRDPDRQVRGLAERALWAVWSRSGDEAIDGMFAIGVAQMQEGQPAAAAETFTEILRRRPQFAEAWNKRATALYMLGAWDRSAADCDEVLRRNPVHFGALSGYGMIWLQKGDPVRALERFEQALAVNPNLDSVEETIGLLRTLLRERGRDRI